MLKSEQSFQAKIVHDYRITIYSWQKETFQVNYKYGVKIVAGVGGKKENKVKGSKNWEILTLF